jgi:hypothetical protein
MRAMRACATANAICLGLVAAAFGLYACAGGGTPPGAPPVPEATAPATSAATATTTVAPIVPPPPKKAPQTAADCKELITDITNDPPNDGVMMNNAMTVKDAGVSNRAQPLTDAIKARRDGFRCCFDIYAKSHAGASGSVLMHLVVKPDGTVREVTFKETNNRVSAPEVEGCMSDLAKSIPFAKSPSGQDTLFNYPFDFKARR